ncbi:TetR/AcrR family transcriptional regulator [Promicromonospora aerolata]|uniref:TetR/AcrR family transcriptional regulator n=1 Tax=Promicromonospora aerolata TaxID=195749 RepID=A0ABW4V5C1_9MICO
MRCVECGGDLGAAAGTGRPRRYCSRSCQSRAYRRRRDSGRLARPTPRPPGTGSAAQADRTGDDLVRVAVALADAHGIAAVTLRTVARDAGAGLPAVRRAFGSRDRLVAMLVQQVLARPQPPAPSSESPVRRLTRLAEEEWAAYRAHPWLVPVLASSRPPLVPAVLDAARASTEAFEALGLDPPSALGRYLALSGYVQGMALLLLAERAEAARSGTTYQAWWSEEARRLDRTGAGRTHSWLVAANEGRLPEAFDTDTDGWFRDGLHRVLVGLVT